MVRAYQIEFRDEAARDLERLDRAVAQRILNKIRWVSENLDSIRPEKLSGEFGKLYKLRMGDWRVGYTVQSRVITIHIVGHRSEIYKQGR